MAKLPYMKLFWPDFFFDPRVQALTTEARGIYVLLLGVLWMSDGWIAADDKVIARRLGLDVRVWRSRYKAEIVPLLSDFQAPLVGRSYTQKRLQRELAKATDLRAIRIANLGMSEAEYEAKRAVAPAKPASKKRAQHGTPNRPPKPAAEPALPSSGDSHSHKDTTYPAKAGNSYPAAGRAAVHTERSGPTPHNIDAVALPPRAMPEAEPEPPSNPALVKRLVADGLKPGKALSLSEIVAELTGDDDANRKG